MRIDHLGMWTDDLDRLASFYGTYFGASIGENYKNPAKGFESRFLTFATGARLEIMRTALLHPVKHASGAQRMGLAHLALSVGSRRIVDDLTARLRAAGYPVLDGPRLTGDGFYDSVVCDPDGNRVEITA